MIDTDGSFKSPFTAAQVKIMECLRGGLLPKDVHTKLGLSRHTVSTQISRICIRLGVENWLEALSVYRRQIGEDPLTKVGGGELTQVELQRRWNAPAVQDARAAPLVETLNEAERLMRSLLGLPIVHRLWPGSVPELLLALEALNKARQKLGRS